MRKVYANCEFPVVCLFHIRTNTEEGGGICPEQHRSQFATGKTYSYQIQATNWDVRTRPCRPYLLVGIHDLQPDVLLL